MLDCIYLYYNSAYHKLCGVFANKTSTLPKKKCLVVSKETHFYCTFPSKIAECFIVYYEFYEPTTQGIGKPTDSVTAQLCRPSVIVAAVGDLLAAAN